MFDGARSRFPLLLPILNQETVARRIIKAVRRNAVELQMPPLVYTTDIMRGLFPAWAFDKTVRQFICYCVEAAERTAYVNENHDLRREFD